METTNKKRKLQIADIYVKIMKHNNSLYCLSVYSHVVEVQKHAYE